MREHPVDTLVDSGEYGLRSFDVTVATHEQLHAARPEAQRYRTVVLAASDAEAFRITCEMGARHGEVTGVYLRL